MGADRKVTEFTRQYKFKLDIQRRARKSVGWEKDLYSNLSQNDPERRYQLERVFMRAVDDLAYHAVAYMLETGAPPSDQGRRNAWARFLMSLIHRHPSSVKYLRDRITADDKQVMADIEAEYANLREEDGPDTFKEYLERAGSRLVDEAIIHLLREVIDSERIGQTLVRMVWGVAVMRKPPFPLLTSDSPLMMSDGLGGPRAFVVLPISPYSYFVAANRDETIRGFQREPEKQAIYNINHAVCVQAERFVMAHDESQARFVDNRLGLADRHRISRTVNGRIFWGNPYVREPVTPRVTPDWRTTLVPGRGGLKIAEN
jgi:hypothetical protein